MNRQTKNGSGNNNGNGIRPAAGSALLAADVAGSHEVSVPPLVDGDDAATNDAACSSMVVADAGSPHA